MRRDRDAADTGRDLEVLPVEAPTPLAGEPRSVRTVAFDLEVAALEPGWWPDATATVRRLAAVASRWWIDVTEPVRALAARHRIEVTAHRGFSPRRHSEVRHRVRGVAAAQVLVAVRSPGTRGWSEQRDRSGLVLRWDASGFHYDMTDRLHRTPARLHVPWSCPDLPMWLTVQEWSHDTVVVGLSLRSRRRLRYPRRYYHVAHRALDLLASAPPGPARSPRARPPAPAPVQRRVGLAHAWARRALAAGSWR